MRSSIFNSDRPPTRARFSWIGLLCFVLAFACSMAAGRMLCDRLSPEKVWRPGTDVPVAGNYTMVLLGNHMERYYRFYYGIGEPVANAKNADVLILGHSRALHGFRDDSLEAFRRSTGVRVYNYSFSTGDGMRMALQAIRRNQLAPSIVIVNENGFFRPHLSDIGRETIAIGYFRAWTELMEFRMSWMARVLVHRWFPRFEVERSGGLAPKFIYQAMGTGGITEDNRDRYRMPLPAKEPEEKTVPDEKLKLAREFKAEMDQRGIQIVITNVPAGIAPKTDLKKYVANEDDRRTLEASSFSSFRPVKIARELGVPLVDPVLTHLETFDGSHLTKDSAERFAEEFFKDFVKLPRVKAIALKRSKEK